MNSEQFLTFCNDQSILPENEKAYFYSLLASVKNISMKDEKSLHLLDPDKLRAIITSYNKIFSTLNSPENKKYRDKTRNKYKTDKKEIKAQIARFCQNDYSQLQAQTLVDSFINSNLETYSDQKINSYKKEGYLIEKTYIQLPVSLIDKSLSNWTEPALLAAAATEDNQIFEIEKDEQITVSEKGNSIYIVNHSDYDIAVALPNLKKNSIVVTKQIPSNSSLTIPFSKESIDIQKLKVLRTD